MKGEEMITQLPDCINPNKMIRDLIKEKYESKCPICGETKSVLEYIKKGKKGGITRYGISSWRGKDKNLPFFKRLFSKSYNWEVASCACETCGTTWDTPPFPTDVLDKEEIKRICEELNIGSQCI
jgi:hypothetical protein